MDLSPAASSGASEAQTPVPSGTTPALRTLLTLAAAVIVLVGMSLGREFIGPLAIAAVIVIICHPVRHTLERRGWPSWLATTAVIVVSYAVLLVMALMLAYAGAAFADLVVSYSGEMRHTLDNVIATLHSFGLDTQISAAATSVLTPSNIISVVTSFGSSMLNVVTVLFFIFAYVLFMAADGGRYARATSEFGPSARPAIGRFQAFNTGVRRYYVVNATFGLIVAVIDGLALWAMGIPAPIVWGILAFVTNFVPNIGFVLGLIPPMLLALVLGGWPMMLAVIAIYCVVNVVLQVLVQPKFVSDAVNLSLTLSFFSVLFWTFVIGPLGAILSIPLTLLVRALLFEGDPGSRWLRWLSGDTTVTEHGEPEPEPEKAEQAASSEHAASSDQPASAERSDRAG
ncbi:MAG: AI-2E family transporter [Leucobacter sp.]